MKILTINMHGVPFVAKRKTERMQAIAEKVLREMYDVVLFQEVWRVKDACTLIQNLKEYYNPVSPHAQDTWYGCRKGGLMAFVRNTYNMSRGHFVEYDQHSPWWRIWEGDGIAHKGIQIFHIEIHENRWLAFFNTHMQAQYENNGLSGYESIRESQVEQFRSETDILTQEEYIAIGDFNIRQHEPLFDVLMEGWQDLVYIDKGQLDYVFYKGKYFKYKDHEILKNLGNDTPYSDHDGIVVELEVA